MIKAKQTQSQNSLYVSRRCGSVCNASSEFSTEWLSVNWYSMSLPRSRMLPSAGETYLHPPTKHRVGHSVSRISVEQTFRILCKLRLRGEEISGAWVSHSTATLATNMLPRTNEPKDNIFHLSYHLNLPRAFHTLRDQVYTKYEFSVIRS